MAHTSLAILEERHNLLIIQTGSGKVATVPRSEYIVLKFKHYNGNRIFYDFGKAVGEEECSTARIAETYDDGIFNCWYKKQHVQISDTKSIAHAIMTKNRDEYVDIFARWYGIRQQKETIDMIIRNYTDRVSNVSSDMYVIDGVFAVGSSAADYYSKNPADMYVIDGVFAVDSHGVSHYMEDNRWNSLCLVANSIREPKNIELPGIGLVALNEITQTILAKILFLLYPKEDTVFLNQIPQHLKDHVRKTMEQNKKTETTA